ncbi:MAG: tRNA (N(6)-L-threonylcarbamoyladenosine(37)-C(2))-methylthiotransferase MtaB [Candidatus Omnitrophota bacterium]|nr:tRNA (N(6)-L-threonylcarbamoyladenosine(37)-C(2))-methylthiotransferase MtaB [Candidatus Omnitrophota bacterium]
MKTVAFHTLGCKVNQYETQAIREQFIQADFREVSNKEKADVYVINTCTVTDKSDHKSRQMIRFSHRQNPDARVVVTGCYSEKDEQDIKKIEGVDFIVNNSRKHKIAEIVRTGFFNCRPAAGDYQSYPFITISNFKNHTRAFIKIQDGCDQNCSYCKVRIVRGKSKSRRLNDVINQANTLAGMGFKEIVLIGVNLGSYGLDLPAGINLLSVVESLERIDSIKRIRLSSLGPLDITPLMIEKLTAPNKLCRHLHVSLQSGDDHVLKRMNRNYNSADLRNLICNFRNKARDISITLDVMVGFPGEGKENFNNTLKLLEEIEPNRIHIFPYSRRRVTPAYIFSDHVLPREVKNRCNQMKEFALRASLAYRQRFLNSTVQVLVETTRDKVTGLLCGYTDTYIKIVFKGPDTLKNSIIPVEIKDVTLSNTVGKMA